MAQEIEAKMRVADLDSMRKRLVGQGAVRAGSELETNIYFDTPGGSLRQSGKGLRIRIAVQESGENHCTMTFKGPLLPSELKTREEIEFTISDAQSAQQLLERLGFPPTLTFEKRRETWQLGGCSVALDLLPYLGTYMEIEGPGDDQVMEVRRSLGLSEEPLISTAYVSLLARYLQVHAIRDRHIRL